MGRQQWVRLLTIVAIQVAVLTWLGVNDTAGLPLSRNEMYGKMSQYLPLVAGVHCAYVAYATAGFLATCRSMAPTRSGLVVLWGTWWPVLLMGPAAYIAITIVMAGGLPVDTTGWLQIGITFLATVTAGLLAFSLVQWLHPLFAVPLLAVGVYVWFAFPASTTHKTLRNINGDVGSCCTVDSQLSDAFVWGSVSLLLVIIVGTSLLVARRGWITTPRPAWGSAWVLIVVAAGLIGALAAHLNGPLDLNGLEYTIRAEAP